MLCALGVFLIFFSLVLFTYVAFNGPISSVTAILTITAILVGAVMTFFGSVFRDLSGMLEALSCTVEDFYPKQFIAEVTNGTRNYSIFYFSPMNPLLYWKILAYAKYRWEIPSEHYQIWTPLESPHYTYLKRYDHIDYVRPSGIRKVFSGIAGTKQKDTVFDSSLEKIVPHRHEEAKKISSLRFVGLADEQGETILLTMLTQHADEMEMNQTLMLLKEIAQEIEHSKSSE